MGGGHPVTAVIEDAASKNRWGAFDPELPVRSACGELCLHGFEQGAIQNGLLFSDVDRAAVDNFTDVEPVSQEMRERADTEPNVSTGLAIAEDSTPRSNAFLVQVL